jgi:YggT family protein
MHAVIGFTYEVVNGLFSLAIFAMVITAVLSWLIAFDILNLRNPMVRQIDGFFNAVTRPLVAPFQRFVPLIGGVDISFIIAILIISAAQKWLLPPIFGGLDRLVG